MITLAQANAVHIPLADESVHTCVTSPPYYACRKYTGAQDRIWGGDPTCRHIWEEGVLPGMTGGHGDKSPAQTSGDSCILKMFTSSQHAFCQKCGAWRGALGLEPHVDMFVANLVEIFREVKRTLHETGTLWVVISDSYVGSGQGWSKSKKQTGNVGSLGWVSEYGYEKPPGYISSPQPNGLKPGDLFGVPWRLGMALQRDGWWLRSAIVWAKSVSFCDSYVGSCMPECLDPKTEVILRDNGDIKISNLDYIWQNKHRLDELQIASPGKWVNIKDVWQREKSIADLEVGKWGTVRCSPEHRFPVSHDRRRCVIHNIEAQNIRMERYHDYLLWQSLEPLCSENIKLVDLLDIIPDNYCVCLTPEQRVVYKTQAREHHKTLHRWSESHGYNVTIRERAYSSTLLNGFRTQKRLIPAGVFKRDGFLGSQSVKIRVPYEYDDKMLNRYLTLDYDLGRLVGLYTAEGGESSNIERGYRIKWTLNAKESDLIRFLVEQLRKMGLKPKTSCNDSYCDVRVSSGALVCLLTHFVSGKCTTKSLNIPLILQTPREFRLGLWNGYIAGDGHIPRARPNTVRATSASEQLIHDFRYVVSSLGNIPSVYHSTPYDKRTKRTHESWTIGLPYLKHRKDKKGTVYKQVKPTQYGISDEMMTMIDIEVDGNLFLIGDGLISHNSVKDRPTKSHEYVLLLSKSRRYYYDAEAVAEPLAPVTLRDKRTLGGRCGVKSGKYVEKKDHGHHVDSLRYGEREPVDDVSKGRNLRSVWLLGSSRGFSGAHYASFPPELVEPCIEAGTSEYGVCGECGSPYAREGDDWQPTCECDCSRVRPATVLDPFAGTCTTGVVCKKLGRDFVGLDLSHSYLSEFGREKLGMKILEEWEARSGEGKRLEDLPMFAGGEW